MRRLGPTSCAFLVLIGTLSAADKDTQAAAKTRTKLAVKISVEFKDQRLEECLREIADKLNDADGSMLSATYEVGVSHNQTVTHSAKDQSIADVLDGMLKKNALGYIVVSKDKDRYDGFLKITKGNERGYPAGEEPKGKATPKEAAAKAKAATADKPAVNEEKAASAKLEFARSLLKDGKTERAKQRFEELIKQYPQTRAADEARKELAKLAK